MGLFGLKWIDITREEREFCAVLFSEVRKCPKKFIRFMNREAENLRDPGRCLDLCPDEDWDVAFEVAFYRDINHYKQFKGCQERKIKRIWQIGTGSVHSVTMKSVWARKFDLALMSSDTVVVIEAKADGRFGKDDVNKLDRDSDTIKCLFPQIKRVVVVGLHSSNYSPDTIIRSAKEDKGFEFRITWSKLGEEYGNLGSWMKRANEVKKLPIGYGENDGSE